MSEIQQIAGRLRSFAADTEPIAESVLSSARTLRRIASEVDALRGRGIDVGSLPAALQSALTSAGRAEQAVRTVRSQSGSWADQLAHSGTGSGSPARAASDTSPSPAGTTPDHGLGPAMVRAVAHSLGELSSVWLPGSVELVAQAAGLGEGPAKVLELITEKAIDAAESGIVPITVASVGAFFDRMWRAAFGRPPH